MKRFSCGSGCHASIFIAMQEQANKAVDLDNENIIMRNLLYQSLMVIDHGTSEEMQLINIELTDFLGQINQEDTK